MPKTNGSNLKNSCFRHVIFDFDGVLAETNQIKIDGFFTLFKSFPGKALEPMEFYLRANGGLSRYEKIRFFFEKILCEPVSNEKIVNLARAYSEIVKNLVAEANAVRGSVEFLRKWVSRLDFAVNSGSDEQELRSVCALRGIDQYFLHIFGSPATKQENFKKLFHETGWEIHESLFVGDSRNDIDAAIAMGIPFLARKSGLEDWDTRETSVIEDLTELERYITIQNQRS